MMKKLGALVVGFVFLMTSSVQGAKIYGELKSARYENSTEDPTGASAVAGRFYFNTDTGMSGPRVHNGTQWRSFGQDLILSGQDYVVDTNDTDTDDLVLQGQSSGQPARLSIMSKDGDFTDNNAVRIFGYGTPESSRRSYVDLGPYTARSGFRVKAFAFGGESQKILALESSNSTDQLILATGGRIGIGTAGPDGLLHIDGDDDEPTLIVESDVGQTEPLTVWQDSSDTELARLDTSGNIVPNALVLEDSTGTSAITLGTSTVLVESYSIILPPDAPTTGEALIFDGVDFNWSAPATGAGDFSTVTIDNGAVAGGALTLVEDDDNGSSTVILKAPDAVNSSYTITFPADSPGDSTVPMHTSGGTYEWRAPQGEQLDLTVTGTNWTTQQAVGLAYRDINGVWRLRFNIVGTLSSTTTALTLTVKGVTFKTYTNQQTAACQTSDIGVNNYAVTRCTCDPGVSTITVEAGVNAIDFVAVMGDVELDSEPSI